MPAYLEGTTEADWNQATYVLSQQACTFTDFDNYKNRTPTSEDECGFGDFNGGDDNESHSTYVTNEANRMHQEIEVAAKSCDKMSDDEKKMVWKNCTEDCKTVIHSDLPRHRKKDFERELSELRRRYMSELTTSSSANV